MKFSAVKVVSAFAEQWRGDCGIFHVFLGMDHHHFVCMTETALSSTSVTKHQRTTEVYPLLDLFRLRPAKLPSHRCKTQWTTLIQ